MSAPLLFVSIPPENSARSATAAVGATATQNVHVLFVLDTDLCNLQQWIELIAHELVPKFCRCATNTSCRRLSSHCCVVSIAVHLHLFIFIFQSSIPQQNTYSAPTLRIIGLDRAADLTTRTVTEAGECWGNHYSLFATVLFSAVPAFLQNNTRTHVWIRGRLVHIRTVETICPLRPSPSLRGIFPCWFVVPFFFATGADFHRLDPPPPSPNGALAGRETFFIDILFAVRKVASSQPARCLLGHMTEPLVPMIRSRVPPHCFQLSLSPLPPPPLPSCCSAARPPAGALSQKTTIDPPLPPGKPREFKSQPSRTVCRGLSELAAISTTSFRSRPVRH